jgi:cellulose synthase/poly-beta-1,6-N-acetylglucosamine synthase-like glycosyltransferase
MISAGKITGWIVAVILIGLGAYILFLSFRLYGLWVLLYIPQAAIFLMCIYIFFPMVLFFIGFPWIKKMFTSSLSTSDEKKNYFTLLIPAHNEERLLPVLLESLNKQTYSKEYYQVLVIADNCRDITSLIAKRQGAFCIERFTDYPSHKQEALQYAIQQFEFTLSYNDGYICVIDADCEAHPDFLREMNQQLLKNSTTIAIQSYRYVKNAYESNITLLEGAAEALRNWVFCAPRKWIGLSVFGNGSGILFKKSLFEKLVNVPGRHLAEDKEWNVYLSENNINVDYCPCARLAYEAVSSKKDFQKQRKRWIGSHFNVMKTYFWKMLTQSILNLNLMQFDCFCSLIQLPRSLLLAFCLLFSALDFFIPPSSYIPHWGWITIMAGLILYGILGLYLIKARAKDYLAIPYVLSLLSDIVKTTFMSLAGKSVSKWDATRTDNNE